MAKTVAGKISGVLNRKSFFQLWMCIAWNWGDLLFINILSLESNKGFWPGYIYFEIFEFKVVNLVWKVYKKNFRPLCWCAKSEVIFSTLNVYCMKLRGPGQKLVIDFKTFYLWTRWYNFKNSFFFLSHCLL
jgi:hypothetical protein